MTKKIITIILLIFGALCFSSCDLDMKDSYMFTSELHFSFKDTDKQEAIEKYFKEKMPHYSPAPFSGPQYEAIMHGYTILEANVKAIKSEEIIALLPEGEEIAVSYTLRMSGKYYNDLIGAVEWSNTPKEVE